MISITSTNKAFATTLVTLSPLLSLGKRDSCQPSTNLLAALAKSRFLAASSPFGIVRCKWDGKPTWACLRLIISNQISHLGNPQTLQERQGPPPPSVPIPVAMTILASPRVCPSPSSSFQGLPFLCKQMPFQSQSLPRRLSSLSCSPHLRSTPTPVRVQSPLTTSHLRERGVRFFWLLYAGSRREHDSSSVKADPSMSLKLSS